MANLDPFLALADLLPEPMLLVSRDGIVRAVNSAFRECVGDVGDLMGRRIGDLVQEDAATVSEYLRRCATTRELAIGALTIKCRDGSAVLTRAEGALFRPRANDDEALVLLRLIKHESAITRFLTLNERIEELAREVSRRKAVENDLRDQREWLQVTLASIADAVVATDTNGRIVFLNPVAQALTGWLQETAIGQVASSVLRLVREETRDPQDVFPAGPWTPGSARRQEAGLLLIASDGTQRPVELSSAPIREAGGRVIGWVAVFRDVTERRRAEREKDAAHQAAEAANRAKDEFLATLSHELRTPLNAIVGWTRLLDTGTLEPDAVHQAIETIHRNAQAQARLIEDLLDVARIVRGDLKLEPEVVNFVEVVDAAVESVRTSAEARHIDFRVLTDGLADPVTGDRQRLQQVVWNLLSNAIKFTPKGGLVEVFVRRQHSDVELQVRDSGVGIPREFLPHVFERFRQLDATSTRRHGGLGIGLSIVRHLVELHGGTVMANSEGEGRGATFTVRLPLLVGRLTAASRRAGAAETSGAARAAQTVEDARPLHGIRVLVVEDDTDGRIFLARALTTSGATVVTAASVREALECASDFQPHVLLSDIGLPDQDGFSLIRELRGRDPDNGAHIPAVALTGYARPEDRERVLAAGFQRHLAKPVDAAEVVELVAALADLDARA